MVRLLLDACIVYGMASINALFVQIYSFVSNDFLLLLLHMYNIHATYTHPIFRSICNDMRNSLYPTSGIVSGYVIEAATQKPTTNSEKKRERECKEKLMQFTVLIINIFRTVICE